MPRADRTFTAGDLIRFWCNNLDRGEQIEVFVFFVIVLPLRGGSEFVGYIEDLLSVSGEAGASIRFFLRILRRIIDASNRINIFLLRSILEPETIDVVVNCIDDGLL